MYTNDASVHMLVLDGLLYLDRAGTSMVLLERHVHAQCVSCMLIAGV